MARLPRFVVVDQPQHVIVRGINREPIFITDDDYQFSYVLMTNHVHLLITPHREDGLSKVMQMIAINGARID